MIFFAEAGDVLQSLNQDFLCCLSFKAPVTIFFADALALNLVYRNPNAVNLEKNALYPVYFFG